ncbi:MAG: hypothetical protein ACLGI5_07490 [Thermoleophilia bacterium]
MLRNVIDEVVRRRLWPIVVLAALVAVGAPLLFLKSAPPDAPLGAAPATRAAPAGELPARARQLLDSTDPGRKVARRKAKGRAGDPFQPPSSNAAKAPAGPSGGAAKRAAAGAAAKPVPVVITNSDGTQPATSAPTDAATPSATRPAGGTPGAPIGDGATTRAGKRVDVRFGESLPARLHRAIPRMQTFVAGGRVIAIFVKYSPKRDKAVFAIAPSTIVTGGIECRRKQNLCRYVDIPAGRHVRLTTLSSRGALVTRRLDVVRIGAAKSAGATAVAAAEPPANASCLLGRLLTLSAKDLPLAATACKS